MIIFTEIVKHYGSRCTRIGLEGHFRRDLAPNIRLLKQAVANGQDAKEVVLIEGVRTGTTGNGQTDYYILLCPLHVFFLSISFSDYAALEIGIDPWQKLLGSMIRSSSPALSKYTSVATSRRMSS